MTPLEDLILQTVRRVLQESLFTAQVVSVDKQAHTCKIDDNGLERPARLISVEYKGNAHIVTYPEVGSMVTCAVLHNDPAQLQVVAYTVAEEWLFNGGKNGGMIIYSELLKEYNKTKDVLDTIADILDGTPINEPGSGAPSALQTALKLALQGKASGDLSLPAIVNTKMKH